MFRRLSRQIIKPTRRSKMTPTARLLGFDSLESRLAPAFGFPSLITGVPSGVSTGNGNSSQSAQTISGDGRYEVFVSSATNLMTGLTDTNSGTDVFVRDLFYGTTSLVSINAAGTGTANFVSDSPWISTDGRYVAFRSTATNITSNATNGNAQIFRRDLTTNTTVLISLNSAGTNGGNGASSQPSLSSDGSRAAYLSAATDLVAGLSDTNGQVDAFARIVNGNTTLACSVSASGVGMGNAATDGTVIAGDGLTVAFRSLASNLVASTVDVTNTPDLFSRNLSNGVTSLISLATTAAGTADAGSSEIAGSLSDDGRYQVFTSNASDLINGFADSNLVSDIFVRDLQTGAIQVVTLTAAGATANGDSEYAIISGNGRYVVFRSSATNLPNGSTIVGTYQIYRWDRITSTTALVSKNFAGTNGGNDNSDAPTISVDGNRIAFQSSATNLTNLSDGNGNLDVFVRDLTTNSTKLVSVNSAGTGAGNASSSQAVICADGTAVAFLSNATNLATGLTDANGVMDAFSRNLTTNTTSVVDRSWTGPASINGSSSSSARLTSADGRYVAFTTGATNVVANLSDTNSADDVFVRDLVLGTTVPISLNLAGSGTADNPSAAIAISPDGRYVFFSSIAGNLTSTGGNGQTQLYRRDRTTNTTVLISKNSTGTGLGNGASFNVTVSSDGNKVAFLSSATNLVTGLTDSNSADDVFVRDLGAGVTTLVSRNAAGSTTGNATCGSATISANGNRVVFTSLATDLVTGVSFNRVVQQLFGRDLTSNVTTLLSVASASPGTFEKSSNRSDRCASTNGRFQVFATNASDVVSNVPDRNGVSDVFIRDTSAGTNSLVSVNRLGTGSGSRDSTSPSISADGRFVFFLSASTDLVATPTNPGVTNLFRWDRTTGVTILVTIDASGTAGANFNVTGYSASADGSRVAILTAATNMVAGLTDSNSAFDVFVRNFSAGTTICVSTVTSGAATGNGNCFQPELSPDGSTVVFASTSTNLSALPDGNGNQIDVFARVLSSSATQLVSLNSLATGSGNAASQAQLSISNDGSKVAFASDATNLITAGTVARQVYVRDLVTATTVLVSQSTAGVTGNANSDSPILSGDGQFVAFVTSANNFDVMDINGFTDVYRRDVVNGVTELVSINAAGTGAGNAASTLSGIAGIGVDGGVVAFASAASNLVSNLIDLSNLADVFVRKFATSTTTCPNLSILPGQIGNGSSFNAYLCDDGSHLTFETTSTDLVPNLVDFNRAGGDVYSFEVGSGANLLVSAKGSGTFSGNEAIGVYYLSLDGQLVCFQSNAFTLTDKDTNLGTADVFVRDQLLGTTRLISENMTGDGAGNYGSTLCGMTPDGRYVLFSSSASNLIAMHPSNNQGVFRRDLSLNTTILVSYNAAGTASSNGESTLAAFGDNGNTVVYLTTATDAVAGIVDSNGAADVVYRNIASGTNFFASKSSSGTTASSGNCFYTFCSADSGRIFFFTNASDLIADTIDANGGAVDLYCVNVATGVNQLVSVRTSSLLTCDLGASYVSISGDGLRVTFQSNSVDLTPGKSSPNRSDIYVRDFGTNQLFLISVNPTNLVSGNGDSTFATISRDGRYVVFVSNASNLSVPDVNATSDVYRRDIANSQTQLMSVNVIGTASGNAASDFVAISADGSKVLFQSLATNLVSGVSDTNNFNDVFLRDCVAGLTQIISLQYGGAPIAAGGGYQTFAANGGRIGMGYGGSFVFPGTIDFNGINKADFFAYEVATGNTQLVTARAGDVRAGHIEAGTSFSLSANGRYVAFQNRTGQVTTFVSGGESSLYVRDLQTLTTSAATLNFDGSALAAGLSRNPIFSPDGRYLVFESSSVNLVPIDTNTNLDIFRRDLQLNVTVLVSINAAGTNGGGSSSTNATMSADGNLVAFESIANNLVTGDTNGFGDVFVRNIALATTTLISRNLTALGGNLSSSAAISADGSVVAFSSLATNLFPGATDTNNASDLFASFRDGPTVVDIIDVSPDPRTTAVATVDVVLSRVISLASFGFQDLTLSRNGGSNLITNAVVVTFLAGTTYRIGNLDALTTTEGNYLLTFSAVGIQDASGNPGTGFATDTWTLDSTPPAIAGVYFDGSTWSPDFRIAVGGSSLGFPAEVGASQFLTLPWNTVDTVFVQFSESVSVDQLDLGVRGINVANYSIVDFSYDSSSFVARFRFANPLDVDRLIMDLDGDSATGVVDSAGNALAGTWIEGSSLFPTLGPSGVDFRYRFVVAPGDVDRDGHVRDLDLNSTRSNLFATVGEVGFNIFADVNGDGRVRNGDVNIVRAHLFADPPSGPGPNRPHRDHGVSRLRNASVLHGNLVVPHAEPAAAINNALRRQLGLSRHQHASPSVWMLDECFATFTGR